MRLQIDNLQANWTPVSFRGELDDAELSNQITLDGPVELNGEIRRRDERVQLKGTLFAAGTIECSRCLEPSQVKLSNEFDVFFEPETDGSDYEVEVSEENLSAARLTGDTIDLADFAREQVLLNLPVRVLCREDCQGLCETCGANRNLSPCNCGAEAIDPRWEALKGMVKREP